MQFISKNSWSSRVIHHIGRWPEDWFLMKKESSVLIDVIISWWHQMTTYFDRGRRFPPWDRIPPALISRWISLLTHYESCPSCLLPRLSGVSKVSLDRFKIVLCLSVCPWAPRRREWDSKKKGGKKREKKAIPFPGLITEAGGSDMSWLKQHHFCHSCLAADLTNDAVGSRHMPLGPV